MLIHGKKKEFFNLTMPNSFAAVLPEFVVNFMSASQSQLNYTSAYAPRTFKKILTALSESFMRHNRAKYGANNVLQSQPKKPYSEPCQLALFSGKIVGICLYLAITASIWKY